MSKGPGKVERALMDIFWDARLDNAYTTEELCERIYGGEAGKKERVALLRAAQRLRARKGYEDLHSMRNENLGKTHVWFNHANLMSYAIARLKSDSCYRYRTHDPRNDYDFIEKFSERDLRRILRGSHYQGVIALAALGINSCRIGLPSVICAGRGERRS
jgi:hypothetical protein